MTSRIFILCLCLLLAGSCSKDPGQDSADIALLQQHLDIPSTPYNYAHPELPAHLQNEFIRIQDNTPAGNPVTDWGATLGRALFYDTRLSLNRTVSCGSCHQQAFGFADTARFSRGFAGGHTQRHSMALANAVFYLNGRFFWDERAATLEEQVMMPLQDSVEMGMRPEVLVERLEATPFYPILFRYAFGTSEINSDRVARALAQFVRSLVSYRSKYDEGRALVSSADADFPNFSGQENEGKRLFNTFLPVNCAGCHTTEAFVVDNARNNGISLSNADPGIFVHTGDPADLGKFKAPSLKNVALRGRFMHDGSLGSLDEVLSHYNTGIKPNPNLDPHIVDPRGQPAQMRLAPQQLAALKAFLETLTDHEMIRDPKFSSPF